MTDKYFVAKNGLTTNAISVNTTISFITGSGSINSSSYSGTSNNSTNLGGQAASYYYAASNPANFANSTNSKSINGSALTANSTTYFGGQLSSYYIGIVNNSYTNAITFSANASNLSNGTVPSSRISGNYTGITGVGTLTLLSVGNNSVNTNINATSFSGTSNNTIYLNGQSASYYYAASNPSNFANSTNGFSPPSVDYAINSGSSNNSTYLNGQPSSYYYAASNPSNFANSTNSKAINGNAGTATYASTSGTANNSTYLNGQASSYYYAASNPSAFANNTNNQNISGTAAYAGTANNSTYLNGQASSYYYAASNPSAFANNTNNQNISGGSSFLKQSGSGSLMTFNWSGQSGQPAWLWGGSDGINMYVFNPSNFNVNYASGAGYATSAGTATSASYATNAGSVSSIPYSQIVSSLGYVPDRMMGAWSSSTAYKVGNIVSYTYKPADTTTWILFLCLIDHTNVNPGGTGNSYWQLVYSASYTAPSTPGGPTCFPAGSQVLMADKSYKNIENVNKGDMLWTPMGPIECKELDNPTLGNRNILTFPDHSIYWSEEHSFWARKKEREWFWAANKKLWKMEAQSKAIGGLKDNDSIMTGLVGYEFAHIDGWKKQNAIIAEGRYPYDFPLYVPRTDGWPIVVNGYLVGACLNEYNTDYTKISWDKTLEEFR